MPSRQVVFIRHGEKDGDDCVHLSAVGRARADLLPDYLLHPFGEFEQPDKVYVMSVPGPGRHSQRCFETVAPTLARGVPFEVVPRSKSAELVERLRQGRGSVLVCWEHTRIVDLVNRLAENTNDFVHQWGLNPAPDQQQQIDQGRACFDATWVCEVPDGPGIDLRVYRQFDVDNRTLLPVWRSPRTKLWFHAIA